MGDDYRYDEAYAAAARLERPLRTLRALRQPPGEVQRTAQMLLLLLGQRVPPALGPWRWEHVRAGLRDRNLLPRAAAFEPTSVDAETAILVGQLAASVSAERIARASAPAAQVWRWATSQLERVEAALDGAAPASAPRQADAPASADDNEEDAYDDDDFDDSGRQLDDFDDGADRALWREQQSSTVLSGDFDYSILEIAAVPMAVKFLGAGHKALALQTSALKALLGRLRNAKLQAPEVDKRANDNDDDDEGEDEDEEPEETRSAIAGHMLESGGIQRCISLLGAASLSTRTAATELLESLSAEAAEATALISSCGGGLVQSGESSAAAASKDGAPVELGSATTLLSGEGAADFWGLDVSGDQVVTSSGFVSDYGEGIPLAEGMVCVGVMEGGTSRSAVSIAPISGAKVSEVAERLVEGLDQWDGRRLCSLRWERSTVYPPGEEDSAEDSALWREQIAGTVQAGGFAWEALDEAMLGSVLKYLGCSGVLAVQTQAAAALRRRLDDGEANGGADMAVVAAGVVAGGGLHRLVDWLASSEPALREEGQRTLRLLIARCAPEPVQEAVAALAVHLGGQTVLELLQQGGGGGNTQQQQEAQAAPGGANSDDGRGYSTISVGMDGAHSLWGLRIAADGAVRAVAGGSVAEAALHMASAGVCGGSLRGGGGLRVVSVSGFSAAAHGGSLRSALDAAAEAVLAYENSWKGRRVLQLVLHDPQWITSHLVEDGRSHSQRIRGMHDMRAVDSAAAAAAAGYSRMEEVPVRSWRQNRNGELGY